MKELLNKTVLEYLEERTNGELTHEETNALGNAISLIAYYGGMLDMKQLAYYSGMSSQKFNKDISSILCKFYRLELYSGADDRAIWAESERLRREEFLIAIAAGLVERGYWNDTPVEPDERRIAREVIANIAPATIVQSKPVFKGYLAVIEYLWFSVQGNDLKPDVWMRQRYGAKAKKDVKARIDAFLDALAVYDKDTDEDSSRMLLTDLKRRALKIWRQEEEALPNPQGEKEFPPGPMEVV